ncbi:GNAT family acetyltransferase [Burkholderia thailandensis]|nr:GNAT family acetyltransferase [Burkholderia thailandensis]MDD1482749.1 GNAT family acetyltransferase [Burkholderia thailandensis]MDD1488769.1 GNAT family acetyltransferase [Burkholderia thailandensis]MDD1495052.1 GNAT family acetyltransferase [Burkholderia thailandensis]PJO70659.1 GNAT family acetyltransferase [Burkholderia thailandensis]
MSPKRRFRRYTSRHTLRTTTCKRCARRTKTKHPGGHAARRGVARHRLRRRAYCMFSIST